MHTISLTSCHSTPPSLMNQHRPATTHHEVTPGPRTFTVTPQLYKCEVSSLQGNTQRRSLELQRCLTCRCRKGCHGIGNILVCRT